MVCVVIMVGTLVGLCPGLFSSRATPPPLYEPLSSPDEVDSQSQPWAVTTVWFTIGM